MRIFLKKNSIITNIESYLKASNTCREEQPHVPGAAAAQARSAKWSYSMFKVRRGNLVQGKEQWLCFAEQL